MGCWMLQDTDHIEATCVFYVEVGTVNPLEQSTISFFTATTWGRAMLTVHHDMKFSVCFMSDPRDFLRQTSADVLYVKECTISITLWRDFGGCSLWLIPVNQHTTFDQLGTNRRMVGHSCNLQLCATGFILCTTSKLAVTHASLTCS